MYRKFRLFIVVSLCCAAISVTEAATPSLLNYQGRLANSGGTPMAGTFSVQFSLYNVPSGGTAQWQETQSITTDADGLFSVMLGQVVPIGFYTVADTNCYLGIKVETDPELSPRSRLVSAPYALRVNTIDSAQGGTVLGTLLAHQSVWGTGVWGISDGSSTIANLGVYGSADNSQSQNIGVVGEASAGGDFNMVSSGVFGTGTGGAWAGYFDGSVNVTQTLYAAGKFFRIDDPADPANKTLEHACVESNEYKDVYDGTVLLDGQGRATIIMPDWFDDLNSNFRYQLTCVGGYAPVYISSKINNNQFSIAGGTPGLEISWMITGVRKDPYAVAHPIDVEQNKPAALRGKYLNPKEYGVSEKLGVDYNVSQFKHQRTRLTTTH